MKTLVADDDADSLALLKDLLPQWGHEVVTAMDGEQAWAAMLEPDAPRLVVLDWIMPRMDGLEFCRQFRAQFKQNPVHIIVLTSRNRSEDVVQALEAGADDYVTKPFVFDELRARLQVGCRILNLQTHLCEYERLKAVLETTGAVCHEMNQPLQTVMTAAQLLSMSLPPDDPNQEVLLTLQSSVERLGEYTRGMMRLAHSQIKARSRGNSRSSDSGDLGGGLGASGAGRLTSL